MDIPKPCIQIAPMTMETVEAVERLEKECFSNPWSLESLAVELSNPMAVVVTASIDGVVVGYAGMHHIVDQGDIHNIAVTASHRRKGVATVLLAALLDYGTENDLEQLTLEVRASNQAAIALYETFGFEQVGRRKDYYQGPKEDALILTRKL